jgi:hypothetical protein
MVGLLCNEPSKHLTGGTVRKFTTFALRAIHCISVTLTFTCRSRDSSVGIALGYGLDDRGTRVRFPAGAGDFSLHHRVQNGSGAHPASNPVGTKGCFPGGKAAGA